MSQSPDTSPLSVENPFPKGSVERQLYDAIAQADKPFTVATLAEHADCDPVTTREYLRSFTSLGVVLEQGGSPPVYERNDGYFEWDTITELARKQSFDDLEKQV
ncbi:DUF7342 family protein [Natronosalvus vescus]|uniref:DUF7342 family protein n=1 Tax=Natronosalvus vescus TaxID=2953881 RepID=UPI00209159A6|nr:hypothetical protein [Natronosalvus vescus]